jgi:4-hydroxybenzoate polyprenyltransferase
MNDFKIFIELTRINKPIGFMLLFWPCSLGLAYAYNLDKDLSIFIYYLILFFVGSVLMRSAGCIFNDIVDKDFDKKVLRTKNRPITSGKISVKKSIIYIISLCALAFLILIQFNLLTILLGIGSMFLAFTYPFMKRITYWPQLFLGLTFNWGMVMGWTAITYEVSFQILVLYTAAIFWTLGYDTIYGAQDIHDDEIIGIKSTAIKFKKNIKLFVSICYLSSSFLIIYLFKDIMGLNFSTFFIFAFCLNLMFQVKNFKKKEASSCMRSFKANNLAGALLFTSIVLI